MAVAQRTGSYQAGSRPNGGAVSPGGTTSGTVRSSDSSRIAAAVPRASATRARHSFFCQFAKMTWRTRNTALQSQGDHGSGVRPASARSVGSGRSSARNAFTPAAYASRTARPAGESVSYSRRAAARRPSRRVNTSKASAPRPATSAQRP